MSPQDIRALISAFESSTWDEMSLKYGDVRLELSRSGRPPSTSAALDAGAPAAAPATAAPAPSATAPTAPAPAAPAPAAPAPNTPAPHSGAPVPAGTTVTAPSLGLFWRSPQPGAPPFVEVGQQVGAEETVCIVEVMKLMNHVKAGVAGTVVAILPDNGAMVEFGQAMVVVEPAG